MEKNFIRLTSELVKERKYNMPHLAIYLGYDSKLQVYVFKNDTTFECIAYTEDVLLKMFSSDLVWASKVTNEITVPDYPSLDILTSQVFNDNCIEVWSANRLTDFMDRSELLKIDDLCRNLDLIDLPEPGENGYKTLVSHADFPLLSKYMSALGRGISG